MVPKYIRSVCEHLRRNVNELNEKQLILLLKCYDPLNGVEENKWIRTIFLTLLGQEEALSVHFILKLVDAAYQNGFYLTEQNKITILNHFLTKFSYFQR